MREGCCDGAGRTGLAAEADDECCLGTRLNSGRDGRHVLRSSGGLLVQGRLEESGERWERTRGKRAVGGFVVAVQGWRSLGEQCCDSNKGIESG